MQPVYGWKDLLKLTDWNEMIAGGSEPTDLYHVLVAQWLLCPLLMKASAEREKERGWDGFKELITYGGADISLMRSQSEDLNVLHGCV